MSRFFKTNNKESTLRLFNKGILYKAKVLRPKDNNVVNFNWGEKYLYGRVRHDSTPIVLPGQGMLKDLRSAPPDDSVSAVNFVADVFEEMTLQFRKAVSLNNIAKDDPFLSDLVAYRAYVSPQSLYEDYKGVVFNEVGVFFNSNNIKVKNFDEFIQIFRGVAQRMVKSTPFTFPGFVKSRECPILCSGLAIEIASKQDAANDDSKIKKFTDSKNWDFYVNTCDTYGFMIDYNVPWRIVADIDSNIMRQIAARYGYTNPYDLLGRGYRSAAPFYLVTSLRKDIYTLYNLIRSDYWTESQICNGTNVVDKVYASEKYSFEEFENRFGFHYFLELYLFLRLCEEQPEMRNDRRSRLIDDVVKSVKSDNETANALVIFERIINKEFDKVGSYSYIKEARKLQEETAFREGSQEAIRMTDDNDISSYRR